MITVSSQQGKATLSRAITIGTDTTALRLQFWGQENGRPKRFFTVDQEDYYDDINDEVECKSTSPTVSAASHVDASALGPNDDERAPQPGWPQVDANVLEFDRLEVPAGATHKVPLGVTEYRVKELIIGDAARIWLPYDKTRFSLFAGRSLIGDRVQFMANGGPGKAGIDATAVGGSGEAGGPGANAPTLVLDLGAATVGRKLRVYLEGGLGGQGGAGRQGRTGFDAKCGPVPTPAKNGGNGGNGGYAGTGGAGGVLYLRGILAAPLDGFHAFVQGGVSDYVGGAGGPRGKGGRGAVCVGFKYGPGDSGSPGLSRYSDAAGQTVGKGGRAFDETIVAPR